MPWKPAVPLRGAARRGRAGPARAGSSRRARLGPGRTTGSDERPGRRDRARQARPERDETPPPCRRAVQEGKPGVPQGTSTPAVPPRARDPRPRATPPKAGQPRRPESGAARRRGQRPRHHTPGGPQPRAPPQPRAHRGRPRPHRRAPRARVPENRPPAGNSPGGRQLQHLLEVRLRRQTPHPNDAPVPDLRPRRRPGPQRRAKRPFETPRGRAGPGAPQPGGRSPAGNRPSPAVPGGAGKPWGDTAPCEAGARQAPGQSRNRSGIATAIPAWSRSARILSKRTGFVLIHTPCREDDQREHNPEAQAVRHR